MAKKCIICKEEAEFKIKNSNDFYCPECAKENFGDVSLLVGVEEGAQKLKSLIKARIEDV